MKLDQEKATLTYLELFRFLRPYLIRHRALVALVILFVVALAALSRAVPFLIGLVAEKGFQQRDVQFLATAALLYLGIEILRTLFEFSEFSLFNFLGNRIIHEIRVDLMRHTQKLPLEFYNQNSTGRILTRLTNDPGTLAELFTDGIVTAFVQSVILISILISMLLISPKLTLMSLVLVPIFTLLAYFITERIKVILSDQKKKLAEMNGFLSENFNGIKVLHILNQQKKAQGELNKLSWDYWNLSLRSVKAYALLQPSMNLLNASVVISSLFLAGSAALRGELPLAALIAFVLNAQDVIHPLREILEKYQQFQNSLTSADRLRTLFSHQEEGFDETAISTKRFRGHIEFENLSFRYAPHLPWVLKNVSLKIQPGTSLALAGRTGSGKTTFVSLLLRFYEATEGRALIDGQSLSEISHHDLRRRFALIQQDPFLFKGSLRENILLGDTTIAESHLQRALELVGFHDYLRRTGRDLEFQVLEKGTNLSLGERQLIAFLRVLTRDPDLVILDEATANVDSETESLIQKATLEIMKSKTCLIIAHRLSTIENCDHMIVLSKGEILRQGRPRELLASYEIQNQLAEAGVNSTRIAESAAGTADP
ncbi:MAG: ABC transporter ATP-binding protein [Bdellovibrionales bacterium]